MAYGESNGAGHFAPGGRSGKPHSGKASASARGGQRSGHADGRNRPDKSRPAGGKGAPYAGRPRPAARGDRAVKASPARLAALEVGMLVRTREAFAQDVIAKHVDNAPLSPEDRAFATKLALGVASSSGTLDEVIDRCLKSPSDIKDDVRDALRVSAYEIVFLDKSPHAAVDQGVELVKSTAPKAAGLANAVLRKIVAAKREFPFGDPSTDVEALARLHAFPLWLAERLVAELGFEGASDFMAVSNEPAPVFVAVNGLKTTDEAVISAFERAGSSLVAVNLGGQRVAGCYRLPDARALLAVPVKQLFGEGKILVSDAASQTVAAAVLPTGGKPSSFLEIGAGRATKTILLQSNAKRLYGSQLDLWTLDNREFKTKLLEERARCYGAEVSHACTGDATDLDAVFPDREFGCVFIDAPCSGLGTLRRHPEIRWRITERDIEALSSTGRAMLASAASHVEVGGTLAYATCTVLRDENVRVVESFLKSEAGTGFRLDTIGGKPCFSTRLAPRSSDAHFAVRMVRDR